MGRRSVMRGAESFTDHVAARPRRVLHGSASRRAVCAAGFRAARLIWRELKGLPGVLEEQIGP